MILRTFLLLATTLPLPALPLLAETRGWRSADGTKSFRGEFVKTTGDAVTIRNDKGKELTFPLAMLHAQDRAWVISQKQKPAVAKSPGILGGLIFGESKEKTAARIKAGKVIVSDATQTKVVKNMFGTTDVIGNCRTAENFGGKPAAIEFLWGGGDSLEGIHLRAAPQPEAAYDTALRKQSEELAAFLVRLQGEPDPTTAFPKSEEIPIGGLLAVHTWKPESGGVIRLGITRTPEGLFQVAAIFSRAAEE